MTENFGLGRKGDLGSIDFSKIRGGLSLNDIDNGENNAAIKSLFDLLDKNKDDNISREELLDFQTSLKELDKNKDNILTNKELKKLVDENNEKLDKNVRKEILTFLQKLMNDAHLNGVEKVEDSEDSEIVTYDNGIVEENFKDGSKRRTSVTENSTTVEELNTEGIIQKKTTTDNNNNDVSVEEYEEGKLVKTTITKDNGDLIDTIEHGTDTVQRTIQQLSTGITEKYENDNIVERSQGNTVITYNENITTVKQTTENTVTTIILNGETPVSQTIEKEEDGNIKKETTEYNGNDYTTNISINGGKVAQIKVIDGVKYEVQYDGLGNTINIVVQNGESIAMLAKRFGCSTEEIIKANASKVKGLGSNRYFYVGETIKIPIELEADDTALQNRDSAEIAIGKYERWKANDDAMRQIASNDSEIRKNSVPWVLTVPADSTWEERARIAYQAEGVNNPNQYQVQQRASEMETYHNSMSSKILNDEYFKGPEGKKRFVNGTSGNNGQTTNIVVQFSSTKTNELLEKNENNDQTKLAQTTKQNYNNGYDIGKKIYKELDDHAGGLTTTTCQKLINSITKDNVLGVLDGYKNASGNSDYEHLIEGIYDETYHTEKTRNDCAYKIINCLIEKAKEVEAPNDSINKTKSTIIDEINSFYSLGIGYHATADLVTSVNKLAKLLSGSQTWTKTDNYLLEMGVTNHDENVDQLIENSQNQVDNDSIKLQKQLDEDGFCEDLWEGLKWIAGSEKLDEKVKAKLNKFEKNLNTLQTVFEQQGYDAFKLKFKELFGVDYNEKQVAQMVELQKNIGIYYSLENQIESLGSNKGLQSNDYNTLLNAYVEFFKQQPGCENLTQDKILAFIKCQLGKENASEDEIKTYIQTQVSTLKDELTKQKNNILGGNSIEKAWEHFSNSVATVYGPNNDTSSIVDAYVKSQQDGGAITEVGLKLIATTIAAVLTGGASLLATAAAVGGSSLLIGVVDEATSKNGMTMEEFGAEVLEASVTGLTVGAGRYISTTMTSANFATRALTYTAADTGVGIAGDLIINGDISAETVALNTAFALIGNFVPLKSKVNPEIEPTKVPYYELGDVPESHIRYTNGSPLPDDSVLQIATNNGTTPTGGKFGAEKFNQASIEVRNTASTGSPDAVAKTKAEVDLHAQSSRSQTREFNHIIQDEVGYIEIGKRRIDIATADKTTLLDVQKDVMQWTDNPRKATILKSIDDRIQEIDNQPMVFSLEPEINTSSFDDAFNNSGFNRKYTAETGEPIDRLGGLKFNKYKIELEDLCSKATTIEQLDMLTEKVQMFRSKPQQEAFINIIETRKGELRTASIETPKPEVAAPKIVNEVPPARSTQVVDAINANEAHRANSILNGSKGVITPTQAATLENYLTNSLNSVDEIDNFINQVKNRVGLDSQGRMHVYEVQGENHAARIINAAESKKATLIAQKTSASAQRIFKLIDTAKSNSKGLSSQEIQTIRAFMLRSDSLDDLSKLSQSLTTMKKSSALRQLQKDINDKIGLLKNS